MAQQREDIFSTYKPLRNHLRKCELSDSLEVIRAYAQNLQFNKINFPPHIEVSREYLQKDNIQKTRWISEWNLEILAKEVIINSPENEWNANTFRKWANFSRAVNKLKDIEGAIAENYISTSNVLRELERMAHGQFGWQIGRPNLQMMARYYRIYNTPEMGTLIEDAIGITTKELYLIGVALVGLFLKHFALHYPPKIEIDEITQRSLQRFLKHFSLELSNIKKRLISEQNINENYFYSFSSLRAYPILMMNYRGKYSLTCPITTLLFWRITSGLYYEVVNKKNFDNAFGASFQKHIGDCIYASNTNKGIKVFPEEDFKDGRKRKDTIDWIVDDGESAIFVECKAKRMTMPSKAELVINDAFERDIKKMADFIVQAYKTIRDYKDGKYPTYKYDAAKKIYPLIVTLEDWHLFGENNLLKIKVTERLAKADISNRYLSEMPFTICSAQEFEEMIQVIQNKSIDSVVGKKLEDKEKSTWAMATFLASEYSEDHEKTKALFEDDFNSIFPEAVSKYRKDRRA